MRNINSRVIEELNRGAYGVDIGALETLVENIKFSIATGNTTYTKDKFDKLYDILISVNKNTFVTGNMVYDISNFDTVSDSIEDIYLSVNRKYNLKCNSVSTVSINDGAIRKFNDEIDTNSDSELIEYTRKDAVKFKALYICGELANIAYLINNDEFVDITEFAMNILPNSIECKENITIFGDLFSTYKKCDMSEDVYNSIEYIIRNKCKSELLDYYTYYISNCDTAWKGFYVLNELGFKVADNAMVRGLKKENCVSYISQVINSVCSGDDDYSSIVITINDTDKVCDSYSEDNVSYNLEIEISRNCVGDVIYSTKIHDIVYRSSSDYMEPYAIVKPVHVNETNTVRELKLYSVGIVEDNGYTVGSDVFFKVNNFNESYICKKDGSMISA